MVPNLRPGMTPPFCSLAHFLLLLQTIPPARMSNGVGVGWKEYYLAKGKKGGRVKPVKLVKGTTYRKGCLKILTISAGESAH